LEPKRFELWPAASQDGSKSGNPTPSRDLNTDSSPASEKSDCHRRTLGYCRVTLTIATCEIVPDWALTTIKAVPRFAGALPPYPPQPLGIIDKPSIVSAAVAVSSGDEYF